eukprot:763249-Pelagomonas_calceolata.AAC.2
MRRMQGLIGSMALERLQISRVSSDIEPSVGCFSEECCLRRAFNIVLLFLVHAKLAQERLHKAKHEDLAAHVRVWHSALWCSAADVKTWHGALASCAGQAGAGEIAQSEARRLGSTVSEAAQGGRCVVPAVKGKERKQSLILCSVD